jgi:NAD(P)-dependent dehydrogenase (short-subunit alcohol dehydrogenase family)
MNAAIVTGVSRGLGEALAVALIARGFTVLGVGRRASDKLPGDRFRFARCDLGEPERIDAAVGAAFSALANEPLSHVTLINNAAVAGPIGNIGTLDAAEAQRSLATDIGAPLALANLFCRTFVDDRVERRIINISSGAAVRALAGSSVYSIGKAAIEMLTLSIAAEHAEPAFRCISLRPGIFETDMQRSMRSQDPAKFPSVALFRGFKEQNMLKDPADVAVAIVERMVLGPIENGRVYSHTDLG